MLVDWKHKMNVEFARAASLMASHYQIALSFRMRPAVLSFCRWYISSNPNIERSAMSIGGYGDAIHSAWVNAKQNCVPATPVRWTTFWANHIRWTLWGRTKPEVTIEPVVVPERWYRPEVVTPDLPDRLQKAMRSLTYREREAVSMKYGLLGRSPMSLAEIGKVFGKSRERVRQIQAKAERKLAHHTRGLNSMVVMHRRVCPRCHDASDKRDQCYRCSGVGRITQLEVETRTTL